MTVSLENRFQNFLDRQPHVEKIDLDRAAIKDGEKQADYFLSGRKIVAEIKTLKEPQQEKGEAVVDEYLDHTGIIVFGSLPLSHIAKSEDHFATLQKTISRRMTRGIERICRSADKQIGAEFTRLPHLATGLLVLINQSLTDLHPREVSDRVLDYCRSRPANIHYCLLIFESHRARIGNQLLPYPLLLDLTYTARQRRARPYLKAIQDGWAKENGFPYGLPNPEPATLEYHPDSITFGR